MQGNEAEDLQEKGFTCLEGWHICSEGLHFFVKQLCHCFQVLQKQPGATPCLTVTYQQPWGSFPSTILGETWRPHAARNKHKDLKYFILNRHITLLQSRHIQMSKEFQVLAYQNFSFIWLEHSCSANWYSYHSVKQTNWIKQSLPVFCHILGFLAIVTVCISWGTNRCKVW